MAYQVADHNLALADSTMRLERGRLVVDATNGLGVLMNTTGGRRFGRARRAARRAAAVVASSLALVRQNVVKRLIKLARHLECVLGGWRLRVGRGGRRNGDSQTIKCSRKGRRSDEKRSRSGQRRKREVERARREAMDKVVVYGRKSLRARQGKVWCGREE